MHAQSSVASGLKGATKAMSAMNKVGTNYLHTVVLFTCLIEYICYKHL